MMEKDTMLSDYQFDFRRLNDGRRFMVAVTQGVVFDPLDYEIANIRDDEIPELRRKPSMYKRKEKEK